MKLLLIILVLIFNYAYCSSNYPKDNILRMNMLQLKGTHNSYHVTNAIAVIPHPELRYNPPDIKDQLRRGARGIELDVFFLSDRRYFVYHDPNVQGTNCVRLSDCLKLVHEFSQENPTHHWIHHMIEVKKYKENGWTEEQVVSALEEEYIDALGLPKLIQVADMKRNATSLREAVNTFGWLTLGETRGKHLLTITFAEGNEEKTVQDRQQLNNIFNNSRVAFAFARTSFAANEPYAIVQQFGREEVKNNMTYLHTLLNQSIMIRSRADSDLDEFFYRDIMISSGVQIISTDFAFRSPDIDYYVNLPDGEPSRCNPITVPGNIICTAYDIEHGITSETRDEDISQYLWCCSNPIMLYFAMIFTAFMCSLPPIAYFFLNGNISTKLLSWFILLTCPLILIFTRTISDVLIPRFVIVADDLLISLVIVLRQFILLFLYGQITYMRLGERAVGLFVSIIGVIVAAATGYNQGYQYGVLNFDKAFLFLQLIHTISSIVSVILSSRRDDLGIVSKCGIFLLLIDAPQLFLFAFLDKIGALYPRRTMMLSNPGNLVVTWHNMLYSLQFFILSIIIFKNYSSEKFSVNSQTSL